MNLIIISLNIFKSWTKSIWVGAKEIAQQFFGALLIPSPILINMLMHV